jgi:hypothetical protein
LEGNGFDLFADDVLGHKSTGGRWGYEPSIYPKNLGRFAGRQCDVEFVKIQENSDFNVKKRFNGSFTELFFSFVLVLLIY